VFLKVSPVKGLRRFNIRGNLSPRYIGPYEIIEKLNPVAYKLNLPSELEHVHDVFHISQLRKYIPDPHHAILTEPKEVAENLLYEERPVQILDYRVNNFETKVFHWSKFCGPIMIRLKLHGKLMRI